MDGKNQAAVIFLSQHSIPLEQQTMIPLFYENTDEVFKTFIKIITLLREFLLLIGISLILSQDAIKVECKKS